MFTFHSYITQYITKMQDRTQDEIKNEPMLFNCDLAGARKFGGPITNEFLDKLQLFAGNYPVIIDSRVHMLMPGFYPCIPGFHHDDVPRTRSDGQPNYYNPNYKAQHIMCLLNGDICPTQFAIGSRSFPDVQLGNKYYKEWHPIVERYIEEGKLYKYNAPSNTLILFDWQTWHQGTIAIANGWRWFIRATMFSHRKPTNEVRKQVQVYLENPMEGW